MATVGIQNESRAVGHVRMVNDVTAALVQYEFTVIGNIAAVVDEAMADNARGSFHDEDGIILQANEFVAGSLFANPNTPVYWDPVSGNFSDVSVAGYYNVGQVDEVLRSDGVMTFIKRRWVEEITS